MSRSPEQLFERLASEIERLPQSSKIRKELEVEHAYAERWPKFSTYRTLRPQVTTARTEVAETNLRALKAELANQGGMIEWNRSLWETRLDKWLQGYEASGFNTVDAFFDEASAIAEELDRQIRKASRP